MASAVPRSVIERLRREPLRGGPLALVVVFVWVAGALYCSGYERLASGFDNWPESLWWSAAAILPWLALFEWSKSARGRRLLRGWRLLAAALAGTAAASLALEFAVNAMLGSSQAPLELALLRRLPAIGFSLLLILWSRGAAIEEQRDDSLAALAGSIDWVGAADNYIELHLGERTLMRRMTMREAERALGASGFVRVHRRYLVNRRRIAGVTGNGTQTVRLTDGAELPVGRRFAANLGPNA